MLTNKIFNASALKGVRQPTVSLTLWQIAPVAKME